MYQEILFARLDFQKTKKPKRKTKVGNNNIKFMGK